MKFNLSTTLTGKLDKAKGTIKDVSIATTGPALGHGVDLDTKTLSNLFELSKRGAVKSYWTHGGLFSGDRLGEEVGLFSAFYIAGSQIKATFQVFEAFKKAYPARYDYLLELAEKAPKEFGVSISFSGEAVWVLDDGSEIPAESLTDKPANSIGDRPFVRVHELHSADFVGSPAANAGGLFSTGVTTLLDEKQKMTGELSELSAKVTQLGEQIASKEASIADLTAKLEAATKALETDKAAFATKETEQGAKVTKLESQVVELTGAAAILTASLETAKSDALSKESEYKAQIEAMNKTLLEFGAVAVNIYSPVIDHAASYAAISDPVEKTRYWNKHKAEILAAQR
jgi:hypothetical protein